MRDQQTRGGNGPGRWAALGLCAIGCNSLLGIELAGLDGPALEDAGPPAASLTPAAADAGASAASPAPPLAAAGPAGAAPSAPVAPAASAGAETLGAPPAAGATATPVPPSADAGGPTTVPAAPAGPPLGADGLAAALPDDLIGAPVAGEIVFSQEASWEVDGVFQPTFEIHTPTGSYWIVASLGTMVSMQDAYAGRAQWIDFSSGFRPLRNVPALAAPPAGVTTSLDADSQTPTHLRLTSVSLDQTWQWVWDFYVTHVTLTINRAPAPLGFSYRGVPAGVLGTEDQLIQSDGTAQGARNSFSGDAAGPVEWVYIADTLANRSLILMQHTDDALPERYQVRDNDSAAWVFGDGQITSLPIRFSLGLLDSVDHATVSERARFVASAIR
jgi:hypothetical protein